MAMIRHVTTHAGGGRVAHPEQEPEDLMGRGLAEPDHGERHLVGGRQPGRAPGPDGPLPAGAVERPAVGRLDGRHHVGGQGGDGRDGQVPESGRERLPGVESSDHRGGLPGHRGSGYQATKAPLP